jgi:hypothetical protein
MVEIKLTDIARAQAGSDADVVIGQAHGEVERRCWPEPTGFDLHVFQGPGGDYIMYPTGPEEIEVDGCLWDDLGPLEVGEDHPMFGKTLKMPRRASD